MAHGPAGKIYLRVPNGYVAMSETAYDAEVVLQRLLADHPDLLAGDQMNPDSPRRWLLVSREVGIADSESAGPRWSLDHLFLDQEGIPTLVEVKRSSDTRLRREVVGQMLDYAANLVSHLPPDRMRSLFEQRCAQDALNPEEELVALLSPDASETGIDPDQFWLRVQDNVATRHIRLVFVADVIPHELQSIVEFLNENLVRTDVLAVEVKQYVAGDQQTIVPRVIGQTAAATDSKRAGTRRSRRTWTPAEALTDIAAKDPDLGKVAQRVMEWVSSRPELGYVNAGRVAEIKPTLRVGDRTPTLFALSEEGRVYLGFATWNNVPVLRDRAERQRFLTELNQALEDRARQDGAMAAVRCLIAQG